VNLRTLLSANDVSCEAGLYFLDVRCGYYELILVLWLFPRYEGLSKVFLSCPVLKLLLLAGTDRLDRYCSPMSYG